MQYALTYFTHFYLGVCVFLLSFSVGMEIRRRSRRWSLLALAWRFLVVMVSLSVLMRCLDLLANMIVGRC